DQHLLGFASHRACRAQVSRNRGAQRAESGGIAVRHLRWCEGSRVTSDKSRPRGARKLIERGQAYAKGEHATAVAPAWSRIGCAQSDPGAAWRLPGGLPRL